MLLYRALLLVVIVFTPFFVFLEIFGCHAGDVPGDEIVAENLYVGTQEHPEQGGGFTSLHLPFAEGQMHLCTQGAGGDFSHTSRSTQHDLDFDTPNDADEELFAPVSGVAYIHDTDVSSGFGLHVNIDQGDDTYVVVAHLNRVFISDLSEIAAGTLLGHEGCTGACTGDHVHIGLHEGDPAQPADRGTSLEARYVAYEGSYAGEARTLGSEAFSCSLESGRSYASALPVALWHPTGSLVKLPKESDVYRIDRGVLRAFASQDVFLTHGYHFDDVTLISSREAACYRRGAMISTMGRVDALQEQESGWTWLFVGDSTDPDRYRIRVQEEAMFDLLHSWGLEYEPAHPPTVVARSDAAFSTWTAREGFAVFRDGSLLSERSRSDVFVVAGGVAAPIVDWQTYLLLNWYDREIFDLPDGAIARIHEVGLCERGSACVERAHVIACMGSGFLVPEEEEVPSVVSEIEEEADDPWDGEPPDEPFTDEDADGYSSLLDCNDLDRSVHPGAEDVCADGIDQDCDFEDAACEDGYDVEEMFDDEEESPAPEEEAGDDPFEDLPDPEELVETPLDVDLDGYSDLVDCDDEDPQIHPENRDDCDDGIDQDCDGFDSDCEPTLPGLSFVWRTPFGMRVPRITLSGEYTFADGSYGFSWRDLAVARDASEVRFEIVRALPGDRFRLSVEYEDAVGNVSWSCIGPFPPGMLQGTPEADLDGWVIPVVPADDPTSEGCGLLVRVP